MPERSFGRTVRYRRTKAGLSQAKLGDLVGRSASTVRSWERDISTPNDTEVITALAAVLAIDPRILYEKAGLAIPEVEASPTVEQALASLHPDVEAEPFEAGDLTKAPLPLSETVAEDETADERPTPQPAVLTPEAATPVPSFSTTTRTDPAFRGPRESLVINPSAPALVEPSYIEDATQRQLYRVRNLATIVAAVALVVVFVWAVANTIDAIGTWWTDFFSTLRL